MKKLYIATTTLNFNNILSTESISPTSFYENRNFGYKRFNKVIVNNFENNLIAYSKIPYFEINDDKFDNYPLIIEISKNIVKNLNKVDEIDDIQIFRIPETIYFNPNKVKFLFFNEKDKKTTLTKAEPSIETKLLPLYQNKIEIINKENSFEWEKKYLEKVIDENSNIDSYIQNDILLNRIKGFYFAYTLGEIYDRKININKVLKTNINKKEQLLINYDYNGCYKLNKTEQKYLEKIMKRIDTYKTFEVDNNKLISFSDNDAISELYKNIINSIIEFKENINNKEEFEINKIEILKTIGDNFKNSNFEGQEIIIEYIRDLMRSIKKVKFFDIENINIKGYNHLLKSISYFILKGDNLEKLKEKDMRTFKIAFGLWGALFGFSAIPKTLFNEFFKKEIEKNIDIQKFLKNMYKKIHNFDIQEDIKIEFIKEEIPNNFKYSQKKQFNNMQNDKYPPKCPICGADMILRQPKQTDTWKPFYGCSKYDRGKGCKGSIQLNTFQVEVNISIFDILQILEENQGKIGITELKTELNIEISNQNFIKQYEQHNEIEFYKKGNKDMIKKKNLLNPSLIP